MGSGGALRGDVRIGVSGWSYEAWRGTFFPPRLPRARRLSYAAARFRTIEINGTFYGLLKPDDFAKFHDETPADFVFAVKAPRFLTHLLRVRALGPAFSNFLASGVLRLGRKWGPLLWQFPARQRFEADVRRQFFETLPRDSDQAAWMARRHDHRIAKGTWTRKLADTRLRHAIEIRNTSFCVPAFIELLRDFEVALVVADAVEWPLLFDVSSDFVYCRLHGSEELYASGYEDDALDVWARRVAAWAGGREPVGVKRLAARPQRAPRDVFVFFDTDAKVRAPADALQLVEKIDGRMH